jgi:hypothetical protein
MKSLPSIVLTGLLFTSALSVTFSQGCSDAGFCTMGAMKPNQPFNKKIDFRLRSMELTFYRGTTPLTPKIYVVTADLNFSLSRRTSFQLKLPYQAADGTLGNTSGLGDISVCVTRNIKSTEKFDINLTVGGKFPSNQSDLEEDGLPLPMYYQTSLGTYDFITGISMVSPKWLIATGVQHPFNQNNNDFLWKRWENSPQDQEYIHKYAQSKDLRRGTDVMLRVERNFRFSRLNFSVGLLPIYRITNDEITNDDGVVIKPDGAKGLALSGIATVGYQFNVRTGIKALVGHRIVQRERNPDGLTRELVNTISYFYRF